MRRLAEAVTPEMAQTLSGMGVAEAAWAGLLGPATAEDHGDLALPCHRLAAALHGLQAAGDCAEGRALLKAMVTKAPPRGRRERQQHEVRIAA